MLAQYPQSTAVAAPLVLALTTFNEPRLAPADGDALDALSMFIGLATDATNGDLDSARLCGPALRHWLRTVGGRWAS